jgi:hypothetical protein
MTGGVQRDNQESHARQPAEQPHIGPAAERETVQKDQRYPIAPDGYAHVMAVIEGDEMVRQSDAGDGCRTHINMVSCAAP